MTLNLWKIIAFLLFALVICTNHKGVHGAENLDTQVSYKPENATIDPWQGGEVNFNTEIQVPADRITYLPIIFRTVKFDIYWQIPENNDPQNWYNSLTSGSLELGSQKINLNKNNITLENDKLHYQFSSTHFDFLALLTWLDQLLFGSNELTIQANLNFNVDTLSTNLALDSSKNNVVTEKKLPPSPSGKLKFHTLFTDRTGHQMFNLPFNLKTWKTYISPWNEEQANSAFNGKDDDTQKVAGETEVSGISRVLKGNSYKEREVELPISASLDPSSYARTVNLFTKSAQLGSDSKVTASSPPEVTNQYAEHQNGEAHLDRKTKYLFSGEDIDGTSLSPVSLTFLQETNLLFQIDQKEASTTGNPVALTGKLETDGKENTIYYRVNGGMRHKLVTIGQKRTASALKLSLPCTGFLEGDNHIELEAENEYDLKQEQDLLVHLKKPELKINEVSSEINFGDHTIPKPQQKLYNNLPFSVKVIDTYPTLHKWQIAVALKSTLQTENGEKLPADLYIKNAEGDPIKVTSTLTPLYQNEQVSEGDISPINFPKNDGVYLQMKSSNVKADVFYEGEVNIVLQSGP